MILPDLPETGCNLDEYESDLKLQKREIAWNYLSDQEKSTAIIQWQEATVTESALNDFVDML